MIMTLEEKQVRFGIGLLLDRCMMMNIDKGQCISEILELTRGYLASDGNPETWLCMDAGKNKERCEVQCIFCGEG